MQNNARFVKYTNLFVHYTQNFFECTNYERKGKRNTSNKFSKHIQVTRKNTFQLLIFYETPLHRTCQLSLEFLFYSFIFSLTIFLPMATPSTHIYTPFTGYLISVVSKQGTFHIHSHLHVFFFSSFARWLVCANFVCYNRKLFVVRAIILFSIYFGCEVM